MTDTSRNYKDADRSAYYDGMDAAMLRAAIKARRRSIELTGSVPTWRNGKIVYDTEVWPCGSDSQSQERTCQTDSS